MLASTGTVIYLMKKSRLAVCAAIHLRELGSDLALGIAESIAVLLILSLAGEAVDILEALVDVLGIVEELSQMLTKSNAFLEERLRALDGLLQGPVVIAEIVMALGESLHAEDSTAEFVQFILGQLETLGNRHVGLRLLRSRSSESRRSRSSRKRALGRRRRLSLDRLDASNRLGSSRRRSRDRYRILLKAIVNQALP